VRVVEDRDPAFLREMALFCPLGDDEDFVHRGFVVLFRVLPSLASEMDGAEGPARLGHYASGR